MRFHEMFSTKHFLNYIKLWNTCRLDLSKFRTFWKSHGCCGFSREFHYETELAKIFFDSHNDFALPKGPKDFPIKARKIRGFPYF